MRAVSVSLIAAAMVLSVIALASMFGRKQVEQVGSHVERELISGHWFYRYDDGVTVCAWADHIDVICTEKHDG